MSSRSIPTGYDQILMSSFEELARSTEEMNGAQLKAVCVEAGMVCNPLPESGTGLMSSWHYVKMLLS